MGKYQLDDKGKAQVQRFHEKHSTGGINKKRPGGQPERAILKKAKKKNKVRVRSRFFVWGGGKKWNYADQH